MQPLTTDEIIALFPEHRLRELAPPDGDAVDWGVLDYLGWVHPSGHHAYAIIPYGDELKTLSLRRTSHSEGRPRSHMCSWCHFVHRARGAAMFCATVAGSDGRRIIGNMLCSNLDCSVRIRNLTGDPPGFMPETVDLTRKVQRLENALQVFLARAGKLN